MPIEPFFRSPGRGDLRTGLGISFTSTTGADFLAGEFCLNERLLKSARFIHSFVLNIHILTFAGSAEDCINVCNSSFVSASLITVGPSVNRYFSSVWELLFGV